MASLSIIAQGLITHKCPMTNYPKMPNEERKIKVFLNIYPHQHFEIFLYFLHLFFKKINTKQSFYF